MASLSEPALARRFDELIAALSQERDRNSGTYDLLLELQTHQVELELQGRELTEARHILEVSRDHYARLFDLAPVGFAVFDRHGRILEINLTAAGMLGRDRTQLSGTPFPDLLAAGEMRRFLEHVATVIGDEEGATADPLDVELHRRSERPQNGPEALRLISKHSVGDYGPACFSALIDITAERRLERSKSAGQHRAHAILDALPAEVVVLDASGTIVEANDAWRRVSDCGSMPPAQRRGVGCDYLAASRTESAAGGADPQELATGVAAVLERRADHFACEYSCTRADSERWLSLTAAPLDAEGQGAVIVQVDVTDRKHAEHRMQTARETAAKAARVNAVGVLATSLVHELAQPLNAAAFLGQAMHAQLERSQANPTAANVAQLEDLVTKAGGQLERATHIVERVRDFLRQQALCSQPLELDPLIRRAMDLIGWFARQRDVALTFSSGTTGLWLRGDPVQLEQVMVNLICNGVQAIDGSEASTRQVTIETRVGTEDHAGNGQAHHSASHLQITVRDSGPGLDRESAAALFDLFASKRSSGLGMGLPISRDIVESHGGKLWADPSSSGGGLFHFTLPRANAGEH